MIRLRRINPWPILTCGVLLSLAACVTPAEEQQLRDDIFGLQTRILQMENQLSAQGKEINTATSRQEASVSTRLDKIAIELQRIKGDIDALRIGVTTGQLPGTDPDQEGSVGKTLSQLSERITAVEDNQNKILGVVEKSVESGKKAEKKEEKAKEKAAKAAEKKSTALKNLDELRTAFDKKKYKVIAEEGEKVLAGLKNKKEKQEATYIMAESLYKAGSIREAALKYNDYIESKPKDNMSIALLRMGDCFKQLGDAETAKIYYQELIQKYSNSAEAKQAKDKLAKL
ncbi:MAG TPA: tetratricopeptide repeat protein [Oligoflexus sp.]|uniref:tetratricopeptide repeat protein n=1 Tax=Oligoflexus sp. TaxID=1971216 RepID=UPI002D51381F|nr:tetratricopeptide repeat protein [Oligoflexus sp.]HYX32050.1 tetratricopeptide repeat protein [Oligoflexus sp.]